MSVCMYVSVATINDQKIKIVNIQLKSECLYIKNYTKECQTTGDSNTKSFPYEMGCVCEHTELNLFIIICRGPG
jgi:hypothetical protein